MHIKSFHAISASWRSLLGSFTFFICFFIWVRGGYFSFFKFLYSVSVVLFISISVFDADALYIYICTNICM